MDNSLECAKAYRFLGETFFMQDKYDDAYMNFAAAYEIAKNLLGEEHQEVKQIQLLLTASFFKDDKQVDCRISATFQYDLKLYFVKSFF